MAEQDGTAGAAVLFQLHGHTWLDTSSAGIIRSYESIWHLTSQTYDQTQSTPWMIPVIVWWGASLSLKTSEPHQQPDKHWRCNTRRDSAAECCIYPLRCIQKSCHFGEIWWFESSCLHLMSSLHEMTFSQLHHKERAETCRIVLTVSVLLVSISLSYTQTHNILYNHCYLKCMQWKTLFHNYHIGVDVKHDGG